MKPLVAIFAHPDDEAFFSSGTLALEAKKRDIYLIVVTCGEKGQNNRPHTTRPLNLIRCDEVKESAKALGIKKIHFLNYKDGTLSNNKYHDIARDITNILDTIQPDTLVTFDHHGLSGHLDHIAVSMITTYIFNRTPYLKTLWYNTLPKSHTDELKDYFIYVPDGHEMEHIDKTVRVSSVWDQKMQSIASHKSQAQDIEKILALVNRHPKEEYFLVKNK